MTIRVLEGNAAPDGALKNRVERINAVLTKAERQMRAAADVERSGDKGSARILRKRAHDEARMAMRLMGILMIEFALDMTPQAERARAIALAAKSVNGALPLNGR